MCPLTGSFKQLVLIMIVVSLHTVSVVGQCTDPPALAGATVVTTGPYNVGDKAEYACCGNCQMTGGGQLKCQNNGWQSKALSCSPTGSLPCDCSTTTTAVITTTTAVPTTTTAVPTTTTAAPATTTLVAITTTVDETTTTTAPTTTTVTLTTTAVPTTTSAVTTTATTKTALLSTPAPLTQVYQIVRTLQVETEGIPYWAIGLLSALSGLLMGSLLAALLALCCCYKWCPCYRCRCCRRKKYKDYNDIEYYYDDNRQCYVNPHTWQAYLSPPVRGAFLGSYNGYKSKPNPNGYATNGNTTKPSHVNVKPVVQTVRTVEWSATKQTPVVDQSGHSKSTSAELGNITTQQQIQPRKTAVILPHQRQAASNYVVLNGVISSASDSDAELVPAKELMFTKAEKQPSHDIPMVVHSKPMPPKEQHFHIHVVKKHPELVSTHSEVVNQRKPVSAPVVIIDQRGRRSLTESRERNNKLENPKLIRNQPMSYPESCDDDTCSIFDGYVSDESPKSLKRDFLKSKFSTAIDRVLGINMFKKKSMPKTGVWMPHAKPVRTTGGMKNTSTK